MQTFFIIRETTDNEASSLEDFGMVKNVMRISIKRWVEENLGIKVSNRYIHLSLKEIDRIANECLDTTNGINELIDFDRVEENEKYIRVNNLRDGLLCIKRGLRQRYSVVYLNA